MLDGRQRGWNFPYFIGANAVESPLNLHVETGPSVMRITKPGVGSAIPEVCQLIYTGLVQTRTAARSPITLFGCDTRARFVARLFTFEQRNDRARLLNRIEDGEGNGSIGIRSISLVKNCTNFLFSFSLLLRCFLVCWHFFYFVSFLFYVSRRDTGTRGWVLLEIR